MKYFLFTLFALIQLNFEVEMKAQNINEDFLSDIIKEAAEKFKIPAIAVTISNSDSITAKSIYGTRIYGNNEAVTWKDYFHIGSCSKSVLAVIAGKLIEQKKIKWNTKFFDVYPELKNDANPEFYNITLEDLFLCEAGILSYTTGMDLFPSIDAECTNPRYEFIKYLIKQKPASEKKENKFVHLYSNASYTMASAMLERITEKTYEQLVESTFKELGLSVYIGWPNNINENQPWGHLIADENVTTFAPDNQYELPFVLEPAGNLSMNPLDYARYTQLHLQGLIGKNNYLKSETYSYIHFSHERFSIGVANGEMEGYKFSGFDGSAGTFFCRTILVPESKLTFSIMMNAGSGTGEMEAVNWLTMKIVKKYYNWWWKFWL